MIFSIIFLSFFFFFWKRISIKNISSERIYNQAIRRCSFTNYITFPSPLSWYNKFPIDTTFSPFLASRLQKEREN